jgi:hypothetical protein
VNLYPLKAGADVNITVTSISSVREAHCRVRMHIKVMSGEVSHARARGSTHDARPLYPSVVDVQVFSPP